MPKRVIDFDALWASDKLAACAEWAQAEYAWLYGLADASGSFEFTNLRVIWGRVAAIRKNLTLERLEEIFDEFIARGLLFTWEENGKRYGHWTGSDVPGRLPAPSWRARLEKLAPPVPAEALAAYSARFGGSKEGIVLRAPCGASASSADASGISRHAGNDSAFQQRRINAEAERPQGELKADLEQAQAQDWDLNLDKDWEKKKEICPPASHTPEELLEIYEQERGELPPAGPMTAERRARCGRWLATPFTADEFRRAVRCAAATPFLAGAGDRGWRASFDWLIANRSNVRKVLAGEYAPSPGSRDASSPAKRGGIADLYTGMAPRPADWGVRINPAALARIRAREARLAEGAQQNAAAKAAPDFSPKRIADDAQSGPPARSGFERDGVEQPAVPTRAEEARRATREESLRGGAMQARAAPASKRAESF